MADYSKQLDRIIELLEGGLPGETERSSRTPEESTRPRHSGHKGGDFMRQAREAFKHRFKASGLQWKDVNRWITQLFKIGSKAKEGATAEDMIWLYHILSTSLENGFAQAMKDMEE